MARGDWTKEPYSDERYERYRRKDGIAVSCSLDIPPGADDWRVMSERPFRYLAKDLKGAEAAMDYADTYYPMEKKQ